MDAHGAAAVAHAADATIIALLQRQVESWKRLAQARARELAACKRTVTGASAFSPGSTSVARSRLGGHSPFTGSLGSISAPHVVSAAAAAAATAGATPPPPPPSEGGGGLALTTPPRAPPPPAGHPGEDTAAMAAELDEIRVQRDQAEELCVTYAERVGVLEAELAERADQCKADAARVEELEASVVELQCQIAAAAFTLSRPASRAGSTTSVTFADANEGGTGSGSRVRLSPQRDRPIAAAVVPSDRPSLRVSVSAGNLPMLPSALKQAGRVRSDDSNISAASGSPRQPPPHTDSFLMDTSFGRFATSRCDTSVAGTHNLEDTVPAYAPASSKRLSSPMFVQSPLRRARVPQPPLLERLQGCLDEHIGLHGVEGTVTAVAVHLASEAALGSWPRTVDVIRSVLFLEGDDPSGGGGTQAACAKRFADGVDKAVDTEVTQHALQFYRPTWRPALDHWATVGEIKTWMDPLGNLVWDRSVIRGMMNNVRFITRYHAAGQPSATVVPITAYTLEMYQPVVVAVWDVATRRWRGLPDDPLNSERSCRARGSSITSLCGSSSRILRPAAPTRTLSIRGARQVSAVVEIPVPDLLTLSFEELPTVEPSRRGSTFTVDASPTHAGNGSGTPLSRPDDYRGPDGPIVYRRAKLANGTPLLLASYCNPLLVNRAAECPFHDAVAWLPPPHDAHLSDRNTAGDTLTPTAARKRTITVPAIASLPSPVLEYISSRDVEERLRSDVFPRAAQAVPWSVEPYHDDAVDALLARIQGVGNKQRYDPDIHRDVERIIQRGAPRSAVPNGTLDSSIPAGARVPTPPKCSNVTNGVHGLTIDPESPPRVAWLGSGGARPAEWHAAVTRVLTTAFDTLDIHKEPKPGDIAAILQLQKFVFDGEEYLLSFSAPDAKVVAATTSDEVCVYDRLGTPCSDQIFRIINSTMRSLQAREIKPVLSITGHQHLDGVYKGGDFVEPFVRHAPSLAKAEWARGGFDIYVGGATTVMERLSRGWRVDPRGSMVHQIKGLLYHIDVALRGLPEPTAAQVPRCSEGFMLCYRGLAGVQVPQYKHGATLLWAAFSSTSLDPAVACEFAKGSATVFSVKARPDIGGKVIAQWSRFAREKELLFGSNTWLRVANALTTELSRLAGVENESSQLFELEVVCPTMVYCSRLRALLPKARTAAAAGAIFQMEQALLRGDGVVDLSLPSPALGETPSFWQMQVSVEQTSVCPVKETVDWVNLSDTDAQHIKLLRRYAVRRWTDRSSASFGGGRKASDGSIVVPAGSDALSVVPSLSIRFERPRGDVVLPARQSSNVGDAPREGSPTATSAEKPHDAHGIELFVPDDAADEGNVALASLCEILGVQSRSLVSHLTIEPGANELDPRFTVRLQGRIRQQSSAGHDFVRVWRATVGFRRREGRPGLAIGLHGARLVADAVRMQMPLKELHLRHNRIPANGVAYLLEALRGNPNVEDVEFDPPPQAATPHLSPHADPEPVDEEPCSSARLKWSFVRESLSSVARRQRVWFDNSVYAAIKMRCMANRKGGIGLSQLQSFGKEWPKHAVLAFWDVTDVGSVLPIAELNEADLRAAGAGGRELSESIRGNLRNALHRHRAPAVPTLSWIIPALGREWQCRRQSAPDHLLLLAAKLGSTALVHSLVHTFPFDMERVADLHNQTPLFLASRSKAFDDPTAQETLKLLLNSKSKKMIDMVNGWTPLHAATQSYNMVCARSLLAWGLDPNAHDYEGRTPMQMAVELGYHSLIEVLEPHTTAGSGDRYRRKPTKRERSRQLLEGFLPDELQNDDIPDIITETRAAVLLQLQWKRFKANKMARALANKDPHQLTTDDARLVAEMMQQAGSAEIASHFVLPRHQGF